jgi:hypothetical protein
MKRAALCVVLAILFVGMSWAQQGGQCKAALSLQAGGSLAAPAGLKGEMFVGRLGLSLETRVLLPKLAGKWTGALEPGVNFRLYFGELERSLFFFAGAGFLSLWTLKPFSFEQGIVKPRAGLGYNRLLGKDKRYRVALEIGAAWLQEVDRGDLRDILFPLVPHFLLVFGRTF